MPDALREPLDRLGDLLWRTWGALGVSTWNRNGARTVVDPEALIVLTEAFGDLRLSHETIDWGVRHAHLISPSRVRHLARATNIEDAAARWLATVGTHATTVRWRIDEAAVLTGFAPSNKSRSYGDTSPDDAAATVLRLRALTGTSIRSEVVRALHPVARGREPALPTVRIAERAATTAPGVFSVLGELEQAALVRQVGTPRRRRYEPRTDHVLGRDVWHTWHELAYGPWVEAAATLPELMAIHRRATATRTDPRDMSDAATSWERLTPNLGALLGEPAAPRPTGPAQDVAAALEALTRAALVRLTELLERGDARSPEAALPRTQHATPWASVRWNGTSPRA